MLYNPPIRYYFSILTKSIVIDVHHYVYKIRKFFDITYSSYLLPKFAPKLFL